MGDRLLWCAMQKMRNFWVSVLGLRRTRNQSMEQESNMNWMYADIDEIIDCYSDLTNESKDGDT